MDLPIAKIWDRISTASIHSDAPLREQKRQKTISLLESNRFRAISGTGGCNVGIVTMGAEISLSATRKKESMCILNIYRHF